MEKFAYVVIGGAIGVVLTVALQTTNAIDHSAMTGMDMGDAVMSDMSDMDMSAAGAAHQHPPRNVTLDAPMPSVTHLVFPDTMDGYNVQIMPRNFTFTPAAINREVQDNEGHVHIYVNDAKISRVYGSWFHLPSTIFQPGENEVRVTLNANDHSEWAINGEPISSAVKVARPE